MILFQYCVHEYIIVVIFVIRLEKNYQMNDLGSEDVAVEMIACPVNPSDINTIQGNINLLFPKYPSMIHVFFQVSTQ